MSEGTPQNGGGAPDLTEGYPNLDDVLAAILDDPKVENGPVARLEVHCFASGDATYRVFQVGSEEPEGNYLDIAGQR